MRVLLVCLLATTAYAWPGFGFFNDISGPDLAHRQRDVNHLLYRVSEHLRFEDLKEAAANFDPTADTSFYKDDGKAVQHLMDEVTAHRILQQKHWFSLFNTRQREEALMLFDVLMSCKTWEAAVNNAAYFREIMNEGEFVYALYVAVIHSELATGIVLPPLYEIIPHLFTNSEVISKAYTAQMTQTPGTFKMEFTGSQKNPEQRVAYFGEDVGLNTHHVTWHMDYPFWWQDSYGHHLDRKGELFFWVHHQLTVRFDAERLSNHLNLVDELYWDRPIYEGFAPHTTYRHGGEFPARPDNVRFEDVDGVIRVRDMIITESRIRDAIDHGYFTAIDGSHIDIMDEHGIDHLGDVIESSMYSPNIEYYGALHNQAHIILGRQADPHKKFNLPPGVMEHFETATRDPAFFRLHKYMDNIFKEHKYLLPPYTSEELDFPGISLDKIIVHGDLETYFEEFEFDLTNAVDSTDKIKDVAVSTHVSRINHKPFSFEFDITNNNEEEQHAVVRVYLCPHRDQNGVIFSFNEGRWHCIETDKFWTKLSTGVNIVKRESSDSSVTVPDIPSFKTLIEKADSAIAEGHDLELGDFDRSCGIPQRMLLPKGTSLGLEFDLAVAVTDSHGDDHYDQMETKTGTHGSHAQCGVHGEKYPDHHPMGFPFDRHVEDERIFSNAHNIKTELVKITHIEHE